MDLARPIPLPLGELVLSMMVAKGYMKFISFVVALWHPIIGTFKHSAQKVLT